MLYRIFYLCGKERAMSLCERGRFYNMKEGDLSPCEMVVGQWPYICKQKGGLSI